MNVLIPTILVLFAGAMIALQAPTNAMLSRTAGSPLFAALVSFAVGTAALFAVWLATGGKARTSELPDLSWLAWVGGVYGAIYVAVAAYAAPRLGLASLITIGIAGQIAMALLLDHLGVFGLAREPVNPTRIAGAILVVAGVLLVRRGGN